MGEQEKKGQRIYDLLNAETKPKNPKYFSLSLQSNPELNPVHYATCAVLEIKTNAIFHPNIGSLKTSIGKESKKKHLMNLFWRHASYSGNVLIEEL